MTLPALPALPALLTPPPPKPPFPPDPALFPPQPTTDTAPVMLSESAALPVVFATVPPEALPPVPPGFTGESLSLPPPPPFAVIVVIVLVPDTTEDAVPELPLGAPPAPTVYTSVCPPVMEYVDSL